MASQPLNRNGREFTRKLHDARLNGNDRPLGKVSRNGNTAPTTDPILIICKELAPILQRWIDQHDAEMYYDGHQEVTKLSGIACIEAWTGIGQRQIYNILRLRQKWVTFAQADKLLTALGLEHRLDELNLVVNPRWSAAKWEEYRKASCED